MPFQLHTIFYIRSLNYRVIIKDGTGIRQFTFLTDFSNIFCEYFTKILDSADIIKHNKDHQNHQ